MENKITVEIWSDVVCPFCYLGKRQFEEALSGFEHKNKVEVIWRSFELDTNMEFHENMPVNQKLSAKYGVSIQEADAMSESVSQRAAEHGLQYNLNNAMVANTFNAHRLLHLAAKEGLSDEANENMFKAYFTGAKHIGKEEELIKIGRETGVDEEKLADLFAGNEFAAEVRADEEEARKLGISGVPFFLFNRKYFISGASGVEAFKGALQSIWIEANPAQ